MDLIFGNCIPDFSLIGLAHKQGCKCIATFRDKTEGGTFEGEGKKELVLQAVEAGADFVDVEIAHPDIIKAIALQAKAAGCKIIGSWHDFGTNVESSKMVGAIQKAKELQIDIAKVAFVVSNEKEDKKTIAEVSEKAKLAGIPFVVSPMGANAAKNRTYALTQGSEFAYCKVDESDGIAGVPAFKELSENIGSE